MEEEGAVYFRESDKRSQVLNQVRSLINSDTTPYKEVPLNDIPTWILNRRIRYENKDEMGKLEGTPEMGYIRRDLIGWGFLPKRKRQLRFETDLGLRYQQIVKKSQKGYYLRHKKEQLPSLRAKLFNIMEQIQQLEQVEAM